MPEDKATPQGDWVCPNCGPLDGSRVTYEERCDTCLSEVFWVTDDKILVDKATHDALVAALKKAVWELNVIRARDGVPYTYDGYKASVCPEYFSSVVDEGFAALALAGETV